MAMRGWPPQRQETNDPCPCCAGKGYKRTQLCGEIFADQYSGSYVRVRCHACNGTGLSQGARRDRLMERGIERDAAELMVICDLDPPIVTPHSSNTGILMIGVETGAGVNDRAGV